MNINDTIDTPEAWNSLPVGAQVTDKDGWVYTKTHDWDLASGSSKGPHGTTSTYVDPEGRRGTFGCPWGWGAWVTSLPSQVRDAAEARDLLASEVRDAAEARDTLASVLDYAIERLPQPDRDRVFGFWDALQG